MRAQQIIWRSQNIVARLMLGQQTSLLLSLLCLIWEKLSCWNHITNVCPPPPPLLIFFFNFYVVFILGVSFKSQVIKDAHNTRQSTKRKLAEVIADEKYPV